MSKILIFIMCLMNPIANGHPHSFIDLNSSLVTEKQTLTGIKMTWFMDEFTSSELLHDAALAKNSPTVWKSMADEIMENTVAQHYFTEMHSGGLSVEFSRKPQNYSLARYGNKAVLSFVLLLEKPVSLVSNTITISTFEQSYYVDMSYVTDDAFSLPKDIAARCKVSIQMPKPDSSLLAYAKSLDKGDVPEEDMALGSKFAQTVIITCK